ncbi:MAG: BspA family leucine-rich repeat surface protein, partial [Methylophagaceae bacterium]
GKNTFNGDISSWDTSSVTDIIFMFENAYAFNQPIGNWDVSNVTSLYRMFGSARAFNQDLSNWDVSNVTNMSDVFFLAEAFNQDISGWDTGNVTNMSYLFGGASSFNQDISNWCVTDIIEEPNGFSTNSPLIQTNKPAWGTCPKTPITDANFQTAINTCLTTNPEDGMCSDSEYGSMPDWDVSSVTDMSNAFEGKNTFNGDISSWDTSSVTNMTNMFAVASSFNQDISAWDVSNVTDMDYMFSNAVLFNQNLWNWQLNSAAVSVTDMFYEATAALALGYNATPSITEDSNDLWRLSDVAPPNMFQPTTKDQLQTAVNGWIDGTITADSPVPSGQGSGTYGAMNTWDVSLITDMSWLFDRKQNFNEDISNWDTSSVTNMYAMFYEASSFNQPLNAWVTSSVTHMGEMFYQASSFNQPLNAWVTSSVTNMVAMFERASAFNQPLNTWNTSSVSNMGAMFLFASDFNQDISAWDVSNVTDMRYLFENAVLFNKNLWNWQLNSDDVSVTNMFKGATAALALGYKATPSITQDSNDLWRLSDVAPPNLFQPTTKDELQAAVNGWTASPQTITAASPVPSGQG